MLGLLFSLWSAAQGKLPIALDELLVVPVFGITFAQTSLLGFWAVFSPTAGWKRLAGLIVGIVYLELVFATGLPTGDLSLLVTMTTGGITAVFGVVRWRYARLQHFPNHTSLTAQEGLKFSIGGIMLFTLVVAVTIVGIKALRDNVIMGGSGVYVAIWSLCFAVVGMAGVWAGLGLARPVLRSIVVLLMSGILGALFAYSVGQERGEVYFYITSVMVLQAAILVASLLVVRSCGYRLVRRHVADLERPDEAEEHPSSEVLPEATGIWHS